MAENHALLLAGMLAIPAMLDRKKKRRESLIETMRDAARVGPPGEATAMSMAADLIEEGMLTL